MTGAHDFTNSGLARRGEALSQSGGEVVSMDAGGTAIVIEATSPPTSATPMTEENR